MKTEAMIRAVQQKLGIEVDFFIAPSPGWKATRRPGRCQRSSG